MLNVKHLLHNLINLLNAVQSINTLAAYLHVFRAIKTMMLYDVNLL